MSNNNPYAPSAVNLANQLLQPQATIKLVGHKIRSTAFRIFNENFWPLNGLALLSIFMQGSANSVGFGAIIIPHLYAGTALAGYRYYKNQGNIDTYFDGFRSFGQVLLIGLAFLPFILIIATIYGLLLFAYWAASMESSVLGLLAFIIFPIVGIVLLYIRARWILAFPLAVYFNHNAGDALRQSWQLTKESGITITLNLLLFEVVFMMIGFLLLCVGIIPASGLAIAAHGAIIGQLLDAAYPDVELADQFTKPKNATLENTETTKTDDQILPNQNQPKTKNDDYNPYG